MEDIDKLTQLVKDQGDHVRKLKAEKPDAKDVINAQVEKLKALKKQLEAAQAAQKKKNTFNRAALEDLLARRFFVRPAFDIYGGVAGLYDLGPPGCAVQANIINLWRQFFILEENMLEVDCTIMTKAPVFVTSGHVERFTDLMVRDVKTGEFLRADHLLEEHMGKLIADPKVDPELKKEYELVEKQVDDFNANEINEKLRKYNVKSPAGNEISDAIPFNLMFGTQIGPHGNLQGYLRPETAQGMFVNFKYLLDYNNGKMPFAAAQIGRSFRNEISPRAGLLRVREFTMAEIEHFVKSDQKDHPKFKSVANLEVNLLPAPPRDNPTAERVPIRKTLGEAVREKLIDNETLGYFLGRIYLFMLLIGMKEEKLRFRQHGPSEMAHYAKDCWDCEIESSYGWVECVGCADRACYDLERHEAVTKKGLIASERLPQPVPYDFWSVDINMGTVSKTYRQKTAAIKEHLFSLSQAQLQEVDAKLKADGKYSFKIDAEEITLSSDLLKIKVTRKMKELDEYTPGVIEPSFGIGRILYSLLEHSYWVREDDEQKAVLSFKPNIAPIKTLVAPLSNHDDFVPLVNAIADEMRKNTIAYKVDDSSISIGRRYARADELGIPFAITVDFQTVKDQTVTLRDRDSTKQVRVPIPELPGLIQKLVAGTTTWKATMETYPQHVAQEV